MPTLFFSDGLTSNQFPFRMHQRWPFPSSKTRGGWTIVILVGLRSNGATLWLEFFDFCGAVADNHQGKIQKAEPHTICTQETQGEAFRMASKTCKTHRYHPESGEEHIDRSWRDLSRPDQSTASYKVTSPNISRASVVSEKVYRLRLSKARFVQPLERLGGLLWPVSGIGKVCRPPSLLMLSLLGSLESKISEEV